MKFRFLTTLVAVALVVALLTTAMAAGLTVEYKDGVLYWKGSDLSGIYDVYVNGNYRSSITPDNPDGQWEKYFAPGSKIVVEIDGAKGSVSKTICVHLEETIPGKAATCTEAGLTEGKKCSACGEILVAQKEIAKLAHTAGAAVKENEVAATCTAAGSYDEVVYCTVCNAELSRDTKTVDAKGHTEATKAAVEATCTATGLTEGTFCSVCDTVLVAQEVVPMKEHTAGEAKVENAVGATCGAAGSYDEVVYCTACNKELDRVNKTVDSLPHTEKTVKENEVAATCTTDGSYDEVVYCEVCKAELSRKAVVVDELGHVAGEPVVENASVATCGAAGFYDEVVYCTVCDVELSREAKVVDALPHTEEIIPAVKPTYTETGLTEGKKCSVCGEILVAQEVVDKLVMPAEKPETEEVPVTGDNSMGIYVVCGMMMLAAAGLIITRKARCNY